MNIVFPTAGGIAGFVYWLIKSILSWGWAGYGFAIVFFTLFLKLMLSPLDFLNRYFSRKSQLRARELAPEEAELKKTYGDDPIAFAKARQALYRKNGGSGGFGALVMLVSLIVTTVIFFNVMGALNEVSKVNIYNQYQELNAVYQEYKDGDADELKNQLNQKYQETCISFLWIKNIWQADNFWTDSVMTFEEFNKSQPKNHQLASEEKETYNAIYASIDQKYKGFNGWLLLTLLAGATSFLSLFLSTKLAARHAPQKTEKKEQPEEIITYSLRDAKLRGNTAQPTIDPAQINKMMQYIMPVVYMIFALSQTSAFSIYMIASSLVSTCLALGFSFLIDLIIKIQKPKAEKTKDFDATVINPHAKYFKGGKK